LQDTKQQKQINKHDGGYKMMIQEQIVEFLNNAEDKEAKQFIKEVKQIIKDYEAGTL